jgi:cell division protein FtsN
MLQEPKISGFSRFFRGALGTKLKTSENEAYFVIVGSHKNREDAEKQVEKLSKINYKASVYNPYGFSKYYAVVIASNVTKDEAIRIKEKAIEDGLPPDSYVWTY